MTVSGEIRVEARISKLEREWAAAFRAKDVIALQNLMADGYALIIAVEGMPLQVVPRDAWLERLNEYEVDSVSIDHIHVRIYDSVAVVVMLWRQEARLRGQDRSGQLMLTDIWVPQDGEWRLAERHSSRPEPASVMHPPSVTLECDLC